MKTRSTIFALVAVLLSWSLTIYAADEPPKPNTLTAAERGGLGVHDVRQHRPAIVEIDDRQHVRHLDGRSRRASYLGERVEGAGAGAGLP